MNQELEELRNAIIDYTVREFGELKEVAERDLEHIHIDEIIEKDKNAVIHSIELYYYDGFSEPKKINNVDEITIESNYLGDKTDEFMEEYNIEVNQSSLEELQENQFFAMYNIWVNPTKEQLQEFNKSLLLDKNEHLQNFEGYEKLYKDRQVNDVFELER